MKFEGILKMIELSMVVWCIFGYVYWLQYIHFEIKHFYPCAGLKFYFLALGLCLILGPLMFVIRRIVRRFEQKTYKNGSVIGSGFEPVEP